MSQFPPDQPYKTPEFDSGGPGPDPNAASAVAGPAIGLMITAGIGLAMQALSLVLNVMGVGLGAAAAGGGDEGMQMMMQGTAGIIMGIFAIIIGVVILLGAMKMKQLTSWGFALAAAILAMIPCISPCCLLGLPIGIWAIVILVKPEVKSAFS